ncbi:MULTISPECIES: DUF6328 family protein [unclassified Arthrobacter]|uniref:DUF6328 family protein n=1 Tax=unclassified Arthrobacter TaxID=235627 RepID=UPI0002FAD199|nr:MULTISPECIES: DUF6328 family protein [unclassified Arthrobacter]
MEKPADKTIVDQTRQETLEEQSDRNWNELLQELRVMQTGTQILIAFLFTIPFQPTFDDLDDVQRVTYLILVIIAAVMIVLLLGPIGLHRSLFRRRLKRQIVERSAVLVRFSLLGTALLAAGGAALVFDIVLDRTAALVVLIGLLVAAALLWLVYPTVVGRQNTGPPDQ